MPRDCQDAPAAAFGGSRAAVSWLPPGCTSAVLFYVAVKSARQLQWTFLYRSETLAEALAAYRAVDVRAGQARALMERAPDGWHVLAHAEGCRAEEPTEQARAEETDQAYVRPVPT
jgi:hypothetical protein